MTDPSEYSIHDEIPAPRIVWEIFDNYYDARGVWYNPLFQKLYRRGRLKTWFGGWWSFLYGLGMTALINVLFISISRGVTLTDDLIFYSGILPLTLLILIFIIRIYVFSNRYGMKLREDIITEKFATVFTTPISDREFCSVFNRAYFYGILPVLAEVLIMSVGIALGSLASLKIITSGVADLSDLYLLHFLMVFSIFIISTSGLAAVITVAWLIRVSRVIANFAIFLWFTPAIIWILFSLDNTFYFSDHLTSISSFLNLPMPLLPAISTFGPFFIFTFTGLWGFANTRRPGYYETLRKTSGRILLDELRKESLQYSRKPKSESG